MSRFEASAPDGHQRRLVLAKVGLWGGIWPRWRRSPAADPADVGVAGAASDGVNAPRLACFEDGVSDCDKTLCDSNDHQSMRLTPLFHTLCHNFQGRVMA